MRSNPDSNYIVYALELFVGVPASPLEELHAVKQQDGEVHYPDYWDNADKVPTPRDASCTFVSIVSTTCVSIILYNIKMPFGFDTCSRVLLILSEIAQCRLLK